jgi:hypothetical protein
MATKQDGLRYLKMRTEDKIKAFNDEWSEKVTEIRNDIKKEIVKFRAKYGKFEHDNTVKLKLGKYEVEAYINDSSISTTEITKLRAKLDNEFKWNIENEKESKIRNDARAIEQKILLHGMSEEIKDLLKGF